MESPRHKLEIEWLYDHHECDQCGWSAAEGAIVRLDNKVILELMPKAACYSSDTWDAEEIYVTLLEAFGFDVELRETNIKPLPEDGEEYEDGN